MRIIITSADGDLSAEEAAALVAELLDFDAYGDGSLSITIESDHNDG